MNFYEAMEAVADGETVKRHAWYGKVANAYFGAVWEFWRGAPSGEYVITIKDLHATDWEIVE